MSCNGCRVLRKGCSESCVLRPCLQWIERPEAQGNATVFVAKFFGRAALMSFISAVPQNQRPPLFQSLLYEAVGRTVNPVNGAVGLLWTGNWHLCQTAVETVLRGGALKPIPELLGGESPEKEDEASECVTTNMFAGEKKRRCFTAAGIELQHHHPTTNSISKLADLDLNLTLCGSNKKTTTSPLNMDEKRIRLGSPSMNNSEESETTITCGYNQRQLREEIKLLNLFN